ncbi:phage tail tape measure protein [Salmonella enterica subsp. enterica serovar Derby]|nr:phage tail tape measure protein [Salmonella enterica subsp. enterica serovar Derby]ECX6276577.1 phage tail tape measure protein [Salmonella enterica subsp. enterica serovar Derby]EEC0853721.1 phage tail tape measure protein [Salmonella enterica subsp. enterica serovar Cerro]
MSNNVKLQVLLRAVDQASRPFKSIRTASKSLSGDIRETQKSLRELNGHASRIEGFRKTSAQLAVTGHALEKARQEAEALATQFKNTERPTRAQAKVLESAKRAAEDLQAKYNRLTDSVKRQQRELAVVGINTRNLAHDEQGLKNRISETTAQLNRQRDALARVSAQQAKLNAVKQRYQAGKELAGNMASVGAAGVGIAAAGTMAGVKLLMPGYEFAQKNSELQAVLGVAKDSAEMAALRKQARQLGDNTAAVLMTAASTGKLDKLTAAFKASDGKTAELVNIMQDNLGGDFKEFQSAYEAVGTDLFDQQEGALRKLTQTATKYVLKLDGWIQKNKSLASTIGIIVGGALALTGVIGAIGLVAWPVITGINAIIAAAGAMGAIFTTVGSAVMTAIGAISWPVVAVVAAIVAGALLIRKYWEPVSAFFGGVVEGLKAAFAPVGELFTPLKPVFDWLGEKLQAAWQWFKNLIAPVKATQDTLNRCRDTGVMFGQALADALMLPLNAFNKLRSGIDWVLEKLGVINKESDTLDQTAARTHAATYGTGGYIPATSSYAGYQAYQPVTAPAGRSYVDQSKNEYHISLTGGTAPGTQLDRQLQDALEKYERDKRARARASMMHDG